MNYVGKNIKGYELHEELGAGGFGAVYRASQSLVGREVAVKIILPALANQPDFVRRFESEARLVARLEHPYIVPLYDYWRDPDGAYLVMRFLRAGSLQRKLNATPGARLPDDQILQIIEQVAGALGHAHRSGVVHRDLKPDNIMLDEDGNAYLGDFGLAQSSDYVNDGEESGISGSPNYVSPEQVRGEDVTSRTDIYSFGVMTYELLTGSHPFVTRDVSELLIRHLHTPLPDLLIARPDLPPGMSAVLAQATAKDPAERYADVLQFASGLRAAYQNNGAKAGSNGTTDDMMLIDLDSEIDSSALQNPYKGLRPFEEADAIDFFGRDALIQGLVTRFKEDHPLRQFLAVVGPSGSGKSSVVKAGVIPALRFGAINRSESWFIVEMVPGSDPIESLKQALLGIATAWNGDDLTRLLMSGEDGLLRALGAVLPVRETAMLVIDQFEETFTLTTDDALRNQFLRVLQHAVSAANGRLYVVVTLRADFYDKPLLFEGFGQLMRARTEVVLPLTIGELEQAITEPAARIGCRMDTNLVEALVNDVASEPGALPLLQYVLYEVFERREGLNLTLRAYNESGGTLGALARRAEETLALFNDEQRQLTRQLFLRLVTLGEGAEDTRRRVAMTELLQTSPDPGKAAMIDDILNLFGRYRLLSFDRDPETREPTIEVAHEALIRKWTRLREWLSGSRNDIRLQRSLAQAAAEWDTAHREDSFILSGSRLAQFEAWSQSTDLALTRLERDYLDAGIQRRERHETAEAERAARELQLAQEGQAAAERAAKAAQQAANAERRTASRTRRLLNVIGLIALIAVGLAIFALTARQEAEQQRGIAVANADRAEIAQGEAVAAAATAQANYDRADALRLASEANLLYTRRSGPETIALLGLNSVRRGLTGQGDSALQNAVTLSYPDQVLQDNEGAAYFSLAISPDGKQLIGGRFDGKAQLWDLQTGKQGALFGNNPIGINAVGFSPDGRYIMTGGGDGVVNIFEPTGATPDRPRLTFETGDSIFFAFFSPDGQRLLCTTSAGKMMLFDLRTRKLQTVLEQREDLFVTEAVWSADGERIYFVDGSSRIYWIETQDETEQINVIQTQSDGLNIITLSPDGTQIAVTSNLQRGILVYDVINETMRFQLLGYTDSFVYLTYAPNNRYLVGSSSDRSIYVWDVQEGTLLTTMRQSDVAAMVVVSADSRRIYSIAQGSANLYMWEINRRRNPDFFTGHIGTIRSIGYSADHSRFASAGDDQMVYIWDTATGAQVLAHDVTSEDDLLRQATIAPDGKTVMVLTNTRLYALDIATGVERWSLSVAAIKANENIVRVEFLAGTDQILVELFTEIVTLDLSDGSVLKKYVTGNEDLIILLCDDGRSAYIPDSLGKVTLIDVQTMTKIADLSVDWQSSLTTCALSPDHKTALFGVEFERIVRVFDLTTGVETHQLPTVADITEVRYFDDGKHILVNAEDRAIRIWRTTDWQQERELVTPELDYVAVVSSDSSKIIIGTANGVIRQWDSDVNRLVATVCSYLKRDFSQDERTRYEITDPGPTCPVPPITVEALTPALASP